MTTYDDEVMADSPIGYWPLGETEPGVSRYLSTVQDVSGFGRHGQYRNSDSVAGPPLVVGAQSSMENGLAMIGETPANFSVGGGWQEQQVFSVEFWFQFLPGTSSGWYDLIGRYTMTNESRCSWMLDVTNGEDHVRGIISSLAQQSTTFGDYAAGAPNVRVPSFIHHCVMVNTGTNRELWIDGVLIFQGAYTGGINDGDLVPLRIGQMMGNRFPGRMSHVAYYDHALPTARIQTHFAVGATTHSASLTGSGSLTVAGKLMAERLLSLSGAGTLTTPTRKPAFQLVPLALSGSGTLTRVDSVRTLALSGSGSLSIVRAPGVSRSVALSGSGTLGRVTGIVQSLAVTINTSGSTLTAALAYVPTYSIMVQILNPSLHQAPTQLTAALSGAQPTTAVTFDINGTPALTVTTDSDGHLEPTSINVPETLGAGTHTLTATQAGSSSGSATFTLTLDPVPTPTPPPPDIAPVVTPTTRWVLQDPMPGGLGTWEMPFNPKESDSPPFERELTVHTTVGGGQFHITEQDWEPVERSFRGYLPTQEYHDKLEAFGEINRRFYLIDHRDRVWIVTFTDVQMTARRRQIWEGVYTDWGHDFEVQMVVYNREPLEVV